jgi:hypothetical protein
MACCFEKKVENGKLSVNRKRLRHLQQLIRSRHCPNPASVLNRKDSDRFSSNDYAVSWGMVWFLLQENNSERLSAYLQACRETPRTPDSATTLFKKHILGETESLDTWERRWKKAIIHADRFF